MSRTTVEQLLQSGEPISTLEAFPILRKCAEMLDNGTEQRHLTPARISLKTSDSESRPEVALLEEDPAAFPAAANQVLPGAGNAAYLSPEEIIGSPLDRRSIEFSLGAIAYEMLTGHKAFTGPDLSALVYQICAGSPPRADIQNPQLNPAIAKVFDQALAKDPQQRFASCREFVGALERAAEGEESAVGVAATATAGVAPPAAAIRPPISQAELPAARRRLLLEDEPPATPAAEARPSRLWRIGAIPTALIGIAAALLIVLLFDRQSTPSIPRQTVDPRVGPVAPPPPPDETSDDEESSRGSDTRASSSSPASKAGLTKSGLAKSGQPITGAAKAAPKQIAAASRGLAFHNPPAPAAPAARFPSSQLSGTGEGSVELLTVPPGGTIAVDGQSGKWCTAPCTLLLPPGRHVLSAKLDGYSVAQRIFTTPRDSTVIIALSPNLGTVLVSSAPPGATVSVDGRQVGQSPLTLHLRPGRHRLDAVYGNAYRQQFIDVQPDTITGATFNLQ